MKRMLALLAALALLALPAMRAAAEEPVAMRIIRCPEQGFATLCRPEYDYTYTPDGGVNIELGEGEDAALVTIFKTDAPGGDFDTKYYLNNVYGQLVESSYADTVLSAGAYTVYSLGGREMPGRMFTYLNGGKSAFCFCAIDLRRDFFVRYEAFSSDVDAEIEAALTALAVAVGNFQPDPDYYS